MGETFQTTGEPGGPGGPGSGCAHRVMIIAGIIGVGVAVTILAAVLAWNDGGGGDDDDHFSGGNVLERVCAATEGESLGAPGLQLVSFAQDDDCDDSGAAAPPTTTVPEQTTTTASSDAGNGGDAAAPPDEADLPPGAILFQGSSDGDIGCIACDGAFRYLPVDSSTILVGDAAGDESATAWTISGHVVEFGANIHTSDTRGRYGVALFVNVMSVPPTTAPDGDLDAGIRAGCAIEVGQTSCRSDVEGTPVFAGDRVSISIGEAGTGAGNFGMDWWFVFQPD